MEVKVNKFELNFDAMIFAGEVLQFLHYGSDDFFSEEEQNLSYKLCTKIFEQAQFGPDPDNYKFQYFSFIGRNIRRKSVYFYRVPEAWSFVFNFIVEHKTELSPLAHKIDKWCKDDGNQNFVLAAIDDAITLGLFRPWNFIRYACFFKNYKRVSIKKAKKANTIAKKEIDDAMNV